MSSTDNDGRLVRELNWVHSAAVIVGTMLGAGTLKFLLGGPGIAFQYVDSDVATELEPANMGWFSVDDTFGFETEQPNYAPAARRFEMGTPPTPTAYQASAGMSIIQEVGIDAIRERVLERTAQLIEGAIDRGFSVRTPLEDAHRGGVVNVQVRSPETAAEQRMDDGICVSTRASVVRFSPHFYTPEADVTIALDALAEYATPGWADAVSYLQSPPSQPSTAS